jgi:rubrerythrin
MALDLVNEKGVALDQQGFTWRDLVRVPISKLNDDAFSRVRIILMNGIELEAVNFQHAFARTNGPLRAALAQVRMIEKQQQTLVNWLLPPDQSPLETTIAYEQVAIEVTAQVAQHEPDPYLAQVYRFGMLEDFDHLYRYSALLDRVEGKDANNILQSYTDIRPGRPTEAHHRAPVDNLRDFYDRKTAAPISKLNALTILSGEQQTQNYYQNIGPLFADPLARQLYAEIAAVEEEHVTQYESIIDPHETWLEKWLLHEANEVYNYYSCLQTETNPRLKEIWTRFVDYELGHLQHVKELFRKIEGRDPAEVLPPTLPEPIKYESNRHYVRQVLSNEVDLRTRGTQFIDKSQETANSPSILYRNQVNAEGSPSSAIAAGYVWMPGTETARLAAQKFGGRKEAHVQ